MTGHSQGRSELGQLDRLQTCMTKIYVYGGEATYSGHCDFEWQAPTLGARHKLILFLAQDEDESVRRLQRCNSPDSDLLS